MTMIIPAPQTSSNAATPQSNGSEQAPSPEEIRALESKVREEESSSSWANKTTLALLGLYGLLSLGIAFSTLWINRSGARLRAVDNLLAGVRMAKVKADALNEGKRIEEEGKARVKEIEARPQPLNKN